MLNRLAAIASSALCAVAALASDYDWTNVKTLPDDILSTDGGWSAVRIEHQDFTSHRCAADDFIIDKPTVITEIGFWNVNLGSPPYRSGEWYIYADDGGEPGKLLFAGPEAKSTRSKTGLKNKYFGDVYLTKMPIKDVTLNAGTYWLAFRTYQGYNSNGKNTVGALTTRFDKGSQGYWHFEVLRNGSVDGAWQPMKDFTLNTDTQWAFYIKGTMDDLVRGDLNCDELVDFNDIDAFVTALTGRDTYESEYPGCKFDNGDIDCDGSVDFDDIDGFIDCIVGGCPDCP